MIFYKYNAIKNMFHSFLMALVNEYRYKYKTSLKSFYCNITDSVEIKYYAKITDEKLKKKTYLNISQNTV